MGRADLGGTLLDLNPTWSRTLGVPPGQLKGRPFLEKIHPEDRDAALKAIEKLKGSSKAVSFEARALCKNGNFKEISWTWHLGEDASWFHVLGRDMSETRRMERTLRETQEKFQKLSDSADEGVAIHDNGVIVEANQALARMLGFQGVDEILGKSGVEFTTPEYWPTILHHIRTGYDQPYEVMGLRKDGTKFHCRLTGKPIHFQGKNLRVSTFLDITELKKSESKLRESEEKFRKLAEASTDGIALHDQGIILELNGALARMFGYIPSEMIGRHATDFADAPSGKAIMEKVQVGSEDVYEAMGRRKDGTFFPVEIRGKKVTYQGYPRRIAVFKDISDRRSAEKSIQQKTRDVEIEKGFSTNLIESNADGILAFDLECRYTTWNAAMETISGHSKNEVLGKVAFEVFPFLRETGEDFYFREALGGRMAISKDRPYRTPMGRRGFFEGRYSPLRNEKGEIVGGLAVIRDVTARLETEKTLLENQERFERLSEVSPDGVMIHRQGEVVDVNQTLADMMGYSVSEMIGESGFKFLDPADVETARRHMQSEDLFPYEVNARRKDGKLFPVELQGRNYSFKGQLLRVLSVRDIRDRRRAEEALRSSESRLRALFESSSQSIMLIGKDLRIQAFNPVAARSAIQVQGMEFEINRSFLEYILPQDRPRVEDRFVRVLRGETLRFERSYPGIDGLEHWFEINYNPVRDAKSEITGICMTSFCIDDRKIAEQALRESEEKFRKIFEDASMAMAMVADYKFIKANRAFQELLGYSEGELEGKTLFDITHPEDQGFSRKIADKTHQEEQERFTVEKRYVRKDGQALWVNLSGTLIRDGSGRKIYSLIMVENIHDRKQAEENLRKSEADLRAIFNSGTQMIAFIGPDGRLREFNQHAAFMVRIMTGKEMRIGDFFLDYVPFDVQEIFEDRLRKVLRGENFTLERALKSLKGAEHWFEFTYTPVQDRRDEITGVCMTASLIDERKASEKALRESEEGYRRLVDFSPEAVLVHDGERILFANSAGVKLFGFKDSESAVGRNIWDLIAPQSVEIARQRVRAIQENQEPSQLIEQKWRSLDGKTVDVEVKGIPLVYKSQPAILAIVRDVTESKKNRARFLQYERLAAVGKVIAAIAHEIRNPLAVVSGMSQLLKAKLENKSEFSSELDVILTQAHRLKLFMNDILDYSRGLEIHKTPLDLIGLVEESLTLAQAQVVPFPGTIEVEMKLDGNLGRVEADRDRLEQVLVNLIVNAYQAVDKNGRIIISTGGAGSQVWISVEDNGCGITEQDLSRLFEPFFTTKKNGSGLGLSLSQKIVEAHGGRMEAQALPTGSRFTVYLPNDFGMEGEKNQGGDPGDRP